VASTLYVAHDASFPIVISRMSTAEMMLTSEKMLALFMQSMGSHKCRARLDRPDVEHLAPRPAYECQDPLLPITPEQLSK
jgi:hypothetical protein